MDHLSGYEHTLQQKGGAGRSALDGGASWAGTEQAKKVDGLVRAQAGATLATPPSPDLSPH